MVDRERVIQALERCIDGCSSECPYEYGGAVTLEYCRADLMRDALELLKEEDVVRCRDCVYWDKSTLEHHDDVICGTYDSAECREICDWDTWGEFPKDLRRTDGDWFCADGRRVDWNG